MKINPETLKLIKMFVAQNEKCPYTGLPLKPFMEMGLVSIDHVIPTSKGGTGALENQCLVPEWVNAFKADKTVEEFKKWLKENNLPVLE